jgi:hypothetical protein
MRGIGTSPPVEARRGRVPHIPLFDSDDLPWTSHLSLGWIIFITCITGFLLVIPMGVYLGFWLKTKGRSVSVLVVYTLVACFCAILFLPDSILPAMLTDAVSLLATVLWFVGAFLAWQQVKRHYAEREGSEFHLSLLLTFLFSIWYINYRIRPEFPPRAQSQFPR